jgi:hypothetical protein
MLVKRCIAPGCTGHPFHGVGMPSKGAIRWACAQHKDLIWTGAAPAPGEDGPGSVSRAPRPSSPVQERLL